MTTPNHQPGEGLDERPCGGKVGAHYYCMRCGQSWRPKDTKRFTLMSRGDCLGIAMYDKNPDLSRPWTLPSGMRVQVGKGRTHRTHHLCWYKGVFFCRRCGHMGKKITGSSTLVQPCYEQARDHQNIRRMKSLEGGALPRSVRHWPRPNNIPGEGLKGILQPLLQEHRSDMHESQPATPSEEWDTFMFVNPKDAFAPGGG